MTGITASRAASICPVPSLERAYGGDMRAVAAAYFNRQANSLFQEGVTHRNSGEPYKDIGPLENARLLYQTLVDSMSVPGDGFHSQRIRLCDELLESLR